MPTFVGVTVVAIIVAVILYFIFELKLRLESFRWPWERDD